MSVEHDPDWAGVIEPTRVPRPSEMRGHVEKLIATADVITARTLAVEEIRTLAESWRFTGKGQPDDIPGLEDSILDGSACVLLQILERHGLL